MRIAAVAVFIVEIVLSHTPGERSGAESAWLAQTTGINEGWLRRAAHILLFFLLSLFAGFGWGWIGVGIVAVWSLVDEATKRFVPGRHFSWFDVGLNVAGVVIGAVVWILVGAGP